MPSISDNRTLYSYVCSCFFMKTLSLFILLQNIVEEKHQSCDAQKGHNKYCGMRNSRLTLTTETFTTLV